MKRSIVLTILTTIALSMSCNAQSPDVIYLINGTTNIGTVSLLKVALGTGTVTPDPVFSSTGADAADFILMDYAGGNVGIVKPGNAYVLSMADPTAVTTISLGSLAGRSMFSGFVQLSGGTPGLLVARVVSLGEDRVQTNLFGFGLSSSAKARPLTNDVLSNVRVSGTYGTVLADTPLAAMYLLEAKGKIQYGLDSFLSVTAPPLPKASQGDDLIMLVNDGTSIVMTSPSEKTFSRDAMGSSVFHIYSNAAKAWSAVTIPGSASTVRSFGPWLAFVEAENSQHWSTRNSKGVNVFDPSVQRRSPGREGRLAVTASFGSGEKDGAQSFDNLFEQSDYFPGVLVVRNVQTGKEFTITTNHGDSEVLLVRAGDVFYRVNQTLYRSTIDGKTLGSPVKISTDDAIGNCHRAFVSN